MHKTIIRANSPWWRIPVREIWEYRDLIGIMWTRDMMAIYKQSVLGRAWFVLQPLLTTVVFTVVFTVMLPSNIQKYPVFILVGLLPWNWFSSSLFGCVQSIVGNSNLVKKVYFPREALPIAANLSGDSRLLAGAQAVAGGGFNFHVGSDLRFPGAPFRDRDHLNDRDPGIVGVVGDDDAGSSLPGLRTLGRIEIDIDDQAAAQRGHAGQSRLVQAVIA